MRNYHFFESCPSSRTGYKLLLKHDDVEEVQTTLDYSLLSMI